MLINATILRIDTPGPATTGGAVPLVTGAACKIRCFLSERRREVKLDPQQPAKNESYVETTLQIPAAAMRTQLKLAGYDPALRLALGMQLIVQSDADAAPLAYTVFKAAAKPKGSMGRVDVTCSQN